jgi:arabinofuranan 3-O-arabinosyltransferase
MTPAGMLGVNTATDVTLSLNGGPPFKGHLPGLASQVFFPKQQVSKLRLTITRVVGPGGQVRISEIDAGGARTPLTPGSTRLRGCVQLAQVDGHPLEAEVSGTLDQLTNGQPMPVRPCGSQRLTLGAGDHRLVSGQGWLIDLLDLADPGQLAPQAGSGAAPRVTVTSASATSTTIETESADRPYYLILGQGYDPRWRGTIDGQPLGAPQVLDGYSVGWRIADPRPHRITVGFAPQRWATASLVASLVAVALLLILLVPRRWLR